MVAVVVFEGSFWTSLAGAIGLRGAVVLQGKARWAGGAVVGACICGCIDGLEFSCNTSGTGVILGGRAVRLKLRSFVTGSAPSGACCAGSRGLEGSGGAGFALDIVRGVPCACLQLFPSRALRPVREACAEPAACTTVGVGRTDGAHGIGGGQRGRVVVPSRTETPRRTLRGGSGAVGLRWTGIASGCASTDKITLFSVGAGSAGGAGRCTCNFHNTFSSIGTCYIVVVVIIHSPYITIMLDVTTVGSVRVVCISVRCSVQRVNKLVTLRVRDSQGNRWNS